MPPSIDQRRPRARGAFGFGRLSALAATAAAVLLGTAPTAVDALNKTNVIKIGFVYPFSVPFNASDSNTILSNLAENLNSVSCYDALLWLVNRTNNDPTILPDTRIELVPANSQLDRGTALTASQNLINNHGVAAIIGESNSRNTVTMALAAAVSNTLHCASLATTPQLSVKADYPTTFRVTTNCALQVQGMLALVTKFNITSVSALVSNDEFGGGITQMLQKYAPEYNITIHIIVPYDIAATDCVKPLQTLIDARAQTILVATMQFQALPVFTSAAEMNMMNGDYWFISSTGWTESAFMLSPETIKVIPSLVGVWQLSVPVPNPLIDTSGSQEYQDLNAWWLSNFYPDESPIYPGVSKTFNPSYVHIGATNTQRTPSNCANDPQLSIASLIPELPFPYPAGNSTIPAWEEGGMCMGEGHNYLEGYMSLAGMQAKYTYWFSNYMISTYHCGKVLINFFDQYIKSGKFNIKDFNSRDIFNSPMNISQLINGVNMTDLLGNRMRFDANADAIMDQGIFVYRPVNFSSKVPGVAGIQVGTWSAVDGSITFDDPTGKSLIFSGGKTAPPPPPVIPSIEYKANINLRYAICAVVGCCSLLTILLLGYMIVYRAQKIFLASSPRFLSLIVLGSNVSFVSIWLFSVFPMNNSSCTTYAWLKYMGFAIVFGALLLKTYRISIIFSAKKGKSKNIRNLNDSVLFAFFFVFIALWAALLVVWTSLPAQRPYLLTDTVANVAKNGTIVSFSTTPHCNFGNYNYICLAAVLITLLVGVTLTYSVRNTPSAFNESKWIAIALYNWVVIGIVLNAISNFAVQDPDVIFVMESVMVILTQTTVTAVLIIPKIIEVMAGRGNDNHTFTASQSADAKHHNHNSTLKVSAKSLPSGASHSMLGSPTSATSPFGEDFTKAMDAKDKIIDQQLIEIRELKEKLHSMGHTSVRTSLLPPPSIGSDEKDTDALIA
ncbi:hypothetical protein HK101_011710 [Irineochytrium annulatum]|nr:hypothetical protein HK101_011710 [Irineochytrium annulatum]